MLISSSAIIQELREREALGVTSGEPTLRPQLTSFEKDENSLMLTFQHGTTSFTVKGELHQLKTGLRRN